MKDLNSNRIVIEVALGKECGKFIVGRHVKIIGAFHTSDPHRKLQMNSATTVCSQCTRPTSSFHSVSGASSNVFSTERSLPMQFFPSPMSFNNAMQAPCQILLKTFFLWQAANMNQHCMHSDLQQENTSTCLMDKNKHNCEILRWGFSMEETTFFFAENKKKSKRSIVEKLCQ